MKMNTLFSQGIFLGTCFLSMAFAQSDEQSDNSIDPPEEEIYVTGSRLLQPEASRFSALQVIDTEVSRLFGYNDPTALIAQSPLVTGVQLDSTITGSSTSAAEGVPANGIGASNIALRGLGTERTLVLLNGRRLAASGVRGAPIAPDLNLIPTSLIKRVEILSDGASSIYGADAVAGVANIILRSDFSGFEINAQVNAPTDRGGDVYQVGVIGGIQNPRSGITVAADYYTREAVLVGERQSFNNCRRSIQQDESGAIRSSCFDSRPDNAVGALPFGLTFSTPGLSDIGIPGFSSFGGLLGITGVPFSNTEEFTLQEEERSSQFVEELERFNLFASGYYDLNVFVEDRLYFEASYSERQSIGRFTSEQIAPSVPARIPIEDTFGNLLIDPVNLTPMLVDNPLNPFPVDAILQLTIDAFPQQRESVLNNQRLVAGMKGSATDGTWYYDVYASFDRSEGRATQPVLRENAIRESLDTLRLDVNGNPVCGLQRTAFSIGFLTPQDCVPINFFADSLFTTAGGDKTFATQAETDFVSGNAFNITEIEQTVISGHIGGRVAQLPAGDVEVLAGVEYRDLRIRSVNDIVRQNGLGASEIPDIESDTIGSTSFTEVFAEVQIPLHDMFAMNLSGRFTDEENFGEEFTYSIKSRVKPTDWLDLRATFGTTFRAPNLREQFLAGQVGQVGGAADPCAVPLVAQGPNGYIEENDFRDPIILDNCLLDGVDPTSFGLGPIAGIPFTTGGNQNLAAETANNFTFGVQFSQHWRERHNLKLGLTWFDIDIENTVEEANVGSILFACYNDAAGLASPFCDRVTRNPNASPATAFVTNVDASFVNVGEFSTRGLDYNLEFNTVLNRVLAGAKLDLSFTASQYLERERQISSDAPLEDLAGTIANPEWSLSLLAQVSKGAWRGAWQTQFIGDGQQDTQSSFQPSQAGEACFAPGSPILCRNVDFVDSVTYHNVSITWADDGWLLTAGIANIFDEQPPLVDASVGPNRFNVVVQSGYDLIGRRIFINATRRF